MSLLRPMPVFSSPRLLSRSLSALFFCVFCAGVTSAQESGAVSVSAGKGSSGTTTVTVNTPDGAHVWRQTSSSQKHQHAGDSYTHRSNSTGGYWGTMVRGSGRLSTQQRSIGAFSGVVHESGINVEITIGPATSAAVEFDDNLQDHVILEVVDGDLVISSKGNFSTNVAGTVRLTTPKLDYFRLEGSGDVDIRGLRNDEFTYELQGSGNLSLTGDTKTLEIELSGSGDIDTRDCHAGEAYVHLNGSGNAMVTATKLVDARVDGSGDIDIYGNPARVRRSENGSGNITVH